MTNSSACKVRSVVVTALQSSIGARESLERQSRAEYELSLISRVQLGDAAAFDLLIRPHRRRLEATVLKIVRNAQDAEDVVQQCLLKIFAKLDQFRGHSQFSTWITRIGINQSLMFLRKSRRHLISIDSHSGEDEQLYSMELRDPGLTPEETCIAIELADLIRNQIDRLPESGKSVFVKLYLEHLSMDQTAQVLGISVAAAKSRALRARRDIRRAFEGRFARVDIRRSVIVAARKHHESKAT
ncbi:sigma-70 family RNA polymerase sigma factor [Granulicella sp. L60]|uniref:sigma-70 family RNA polymerase sigma factor n=1 Tax=Granulicella sp. L60 TaxID=1641866 RepID=UPI00131E79AE